MGGAKRKKSEVKALRPECRTRSEALCLLCRGSPVEVEVEVEVHDVLPPDVVEIQEQKPNWSWPAGVAG